MIYALVRFACYAALTLHSKPILRGKKLFCGLNSFELGVTLNHMVRDFASLIGSLLTQLLHTLRQSVSVYGTGKITVRVTLNMDRLLLTPGETVWLHSGADMCRFGAGLFTFC